MISQPSKARKKLLSHWNSFYGNEFFNSTCAALQNESGNWSARKDIKQNENEIVEFWARKSNWNGEIEFALPHVKLDVDFN